MKFFRRTVWALLFVVFFGFALKNTHQASLRFFFDYEARAPLILFLLTFFVAGAALAILALTPTVFRQRREMSSHKRTIESMEKEKRQQHAPLAQAPLPDSATSK